MDIPWLTYLHSTFCWFNGVVALKCGIESQERAGCGEDIWGLLQKANT